MIKIDSAFVEVIAENAKLSERKRASFNLHKSYDDKLQRFVNAIEPYSYVQPHKHENPDKREIFIIIKGKMLVVSFDDNGNIADHFILDAGKDKFAIEIPEKIYHSIFSLESGSIAIEIKDGPYMPSNDKIFATWAPKEGDEQCKAYIDGILQKLNLKISSF
ncbi:MAG: WbuC family cupin fold metalloprotein [Bacteroidetes bacterium]|nr:WbuC family cupin fold metalloprotein [Bacteroidota bacterium]